MKQTTFPDEKTVSQMEFKNIAPEFTGKNSLLNLIFDKSPNAILMTDIKTNIIYVNPAWEKLTGYTFEEIKGKSPRLLHSPKTPKSVINKILAALKDGKTIVTDEIIFQRKDGTEYQALSSYFPVIKNNKTILFVRVTSDITEQKRIEKELRASEESFRQLINLAPDGIFIADINGRYIDVNNAGCRILGRKREEIVGKTILDLIPKEQHAKLEESKQYMLQPDHTHIAEFLLKHKDGHYVPVEVHASILNDGRWLGFVREISERKELERQKDSFIGIATHELKTPLTSLNLYTQTLSNKLQNDKENKPLVEKIKQQTYKLLSLINDLLDVSKIDSGTLTINLKKFDLNICINKILTDIQQTTRTHKIELKGKITKKVIGDENKIEEVLTNLLTNAIKYSPNANTINVYIGVKNNQATISVQDFGTGIAKKELPHIFERFYQTKGKQKGKIAGFGLGLFIVNEIIKRHKGKIVVESKIGKGSTFSFSLPLETSDRNKDQSTR